jgi:hypothetical protein
MSKTTRVLEIQLSANDPEADSPVSQAEFEANFTAAMNQVAQYAREVLRRSYDVQVRVLEPQR